MSTVGMEKVKLLMKRGVLASPVEASCEDKKAWVGVYYLDQSRESSRKFVLRVSGAVPDPSIPIFRLRKFEVDISVLMLNRALSEADLKQGVDAVVFGERNLVEQLILLGTCISELAPVDTTDYPI